MAYPGFSLGRPTWSDGARGVLEHPKHPPWIRHSPSWCALFLSLTLIRTHVHVCTCTSNIPKQSKGMETLNGVWLCSKKMLSFPEWDSNPSTSTCTACIKLQDVFMNMYIHCHTWTCTCMYMSIFMHAQVYTLLISCFDTNQIRKHNMPNISVYTATFRGNVQKQTK